MPNYLMIQNPGVAAPEAFTVMGSSIKSTSPYCIGQFGSGTKMAVLTLLRHGLFPLVYCGRTKIEFVVSNVTVDTGLRVSEVPVVSARLSGKDRNGKKVSRLEDLHLALNYGAAEWQDTHMALREFVSNSIDRLIEEREVQFSEKFIREQILSGKPNEEILEELKQALTAYHSSDLDFSSVVIDLVDEEKVRASADETRVFVPLNPQVEYFFHNIDKWFLHFSSSALLSQTIIPKADRNLQTKKSLPVLFRRGVRIREISSGLERPSLFDYNLNEMTIDEARKADDYSSRFHAGKAFRNAPAWAIDTLLQSFRSGMSFWEHEFDLWSLQAQGSQHSQQAKIWKDSFDRIYGSRFLLASADIDITLACRKGYDVVKVPFEFTNLASYLGLPTPALKFSSIEQMGGIVTDAHPETVAIVQRIWDLLEENQLTNGVQRPEIQFFRAVSNYEGFIQGYYRDGVIYLNEEQVGGNKGSRSLLTVILEELVHHITKAQDNSRDFQNFLLTISSLWLEQQLQEKLLQ